MADTYKELFFDKQNQLLDVTYKALELQKELDSFEKFHPRAVKMLRKQKPFVVVACDEPYFMKVYSLIRENEIKNGRWSEEDEHIYQAAEHPLQSDVCPLCRGKGAYQVGVYVEMCPDCNGTGKRR